MDKITNFIYCRKAVRRNGPQIRNRGTVDALGIMNIITLEELPSSFSFSIIFSILGANVNVQNVIRVVLKKCDNGDILIDTGNITLPIKQEVNIMNIPADFRGVNICMDLLDVAFKQEGIYTTVVFLNDILLGEKTIYVKSKR